MAVAQTGTVEDEPSGVTTTVPGETTTTVDSETTTTVDSESTTTTVAESTTTTAGEAENHGQMVSEAARDHSHDEECGNHGKWVSSVARGLESCEAADASDTAKKPGKAKGGDDSESD